MVGPPLVAEDKRTTTASADFSHAHPTTLPPRWSGSSGQTGRSPRVSFASFTRSAPDLPAPPTEWLLGLPVRCRVTRRRWPCIRFLFVASELGHRLSSDSASRRTPLPSLAVRATPARRGLAPPEAKHTWHTTRYKPTDCSPWASRQNLVAFSESRYFPSSCNRAAPWYSSALPSRFFPFERPPCPQPPYATAFSCWPRRWRCSSTSTAIA